MLDISRKCKKKKPGNPNKNSKWKPPDFRVRTVDMIDDVSENTENVEEYYALGITSIETIDSFVYGWSAGAAVCRL